MRESGTKQERISIPYFEGINSTVQQVIARRSELSHSENARAPMIGVLEKREGQTTIGNTLLSRGEYGLAYFEDGGADSQSLFRVTSVDGLSANIYYLNTSDDWTLIDNDRAMYLELATCDFANVDGNLVVVNGADPNIIITSPMGANPIVENSGTFGSMYNSPSAKKVAFYKSRIYLADYFNNAGEEMKTSVARSSYSLGVVSLLNADVSAATGNDWIFPVVDTKYFYTSQGMNAYEIYRGNLKIASIYISSMTETSVTAPTGGVIFEPGQSFFYSSDEVWIAGTYTGDKQYRWVSNSTTTGRDVKQYDTFKLVGGDEDAITLLEPIGNILMIANKNAMMTWNDYTLENFDLGVGSCSKNGYVKLKGSLYFIHYSGIFSSSGSVPQLISRKIEKYIKGATKTGIETAAAGYKGLSIFFTIGDVTLYKNDGSIYKVLDQVCLEFNIADQNWYVHTNVTASQFETYMQTDGRERLTMSSITPGDDQIIGDEEIVNGSFSGSADSWTLVAGATYSDNGVILINP